LQAGIRDVCVMWNTAHGELGGDDLRSDCYMWSEGDEAHSISSKVTGFSAVRQVPLGRGNIMEKGIVAPEEVVAGDLYKRYMGVPLGEKHKGF
jgi:hypothetical protein